MIVMEYEDYVKYQSKEVFDEVVVEVLDADPGAIYGCDCNHLAHQGMVVEN